MSNTIQEPRSTDDRRSTGAVSVRGGSVRKTPLGWLPWTALLLAGIIGLGALLIARNVGDAGDDPGVDLTDNAAAEGQDPAGPDANRNDGGDSGGDPDRDAGTSSATGSAAATPTTAASAPGAAAPSGGNVTANGRALLPIPAGGLAPFTDQAAEGKGVNVESVVADEGFWVGTDANSRLFVFLSDEAKSAEGESPFQVKAGQKVDFTGTVKPLPDDLTPFGVDRSEGADQLRQQGHYIELRSVTLAG